MRLFTLSVVVVLAVTILMVGGLIEAPSMLENFITEWSDRILVTVGIGVLPFGLLLVGLLVLAIKRPLFLLRKARLVGGLTVLIVASEGILSYFEAEIPYVGVSQLGGDFGYNVRGAHEQFGILRVAAVGSFGLWLLAPQVVLGIVRRFAGAVRVASKGLGLMYRVALRLHLLRSAMMVYAVGRALIVNAVLSFTKAINRVRTNREDGALSRNLDSFFLSSHNETHREAHAEGVSASVLTRNEALPTRGVRLSEVDVSERTSELQKPNSPPDALSSRGSLDEAPSVDDAKDEPGLRGGGLEWRLPDISSLAMGSSAGAVTSEHSATAALIEETLAEHNVEVTVAEIKPGPSVTMFGLVPGWNRRNRHLRQLSNEEDSLDSTGMTNESNTRVKVGSILAREKDLALALAAPSLRLQAPVPGESVVGVEVPNRDSIVVTFRSVMESDEYQAIISGNGLPVALGLASAGEPVAIDLLKMPHLLIAGATGSGKSVCMNSIISSIIAHQSPSQVRLMLVDPKRVELTPYNGVPHLVTPVVTEPTRVVGLLRGAIQEMTRRYKLLEEAGVRNIQSYNRSSKSTEQIPYFVICIDELADLMMTASFEVEHGICRLAQLGRATGIHLVLATQRPSVNVVTGLIKANFPSRIAFAVASQIDSRTILDGTGAERLLGRGDMLYLSPDSAKPRRVQGVLITEEETDLLAIHWKNHPPRPLREISLEQLAQEADMETAERDATFDEGDSLYDKAIAVASANRQLSTSLLQRKLRIGYPRAARLMDQLEDQGIIASNSEAGKPREVLRLPGDS